MKIKEELTKSVFFVILMLILLDVIHRCAESQEDDDKRPAVPQSSCNFSLLTT